MARTVPTNYVLLAVFTICFSFATSFISAAYKKDVVFCAAGLTAIIVISLTVYAFTTKTDFTIFGAAVFMLSFALIGLFIMAFIFREFYTVYCFVAVVLFGFFIIYDTQLIIGG